MKVLIAIKSCWPDKNRKFHDSIRNTWGKDVKEADLRFFVGTSEEPTPLEEDEVILDCGDDYHSLPQKTREILRWALAQKYEYIFSADTDTFIIPEKLMACGFEKYDYFGTNSKPWGRTFAYDAPDRDSKNWHIEKCYPWCSGGYGYFLSRRAAQVVVANEPNIWCEDLWVGNLLGPLYNEGKITMGNMDRGISWHYYRTPQAWWYDPASGWMEKLYAETR